MDIATHILEPLRSKYPQEKISTMLNFDNLWKLQSIFKEIVLITTDPEFESGHQLSVKIWQLLEMLVHMQSLTAAIRAELIEELAFIRPDLSQEIMKMKTGADKVVLFDRRKADPDRRRVTTFLANDRRSGIADRRKIIQKKFRG